MACHTLLVLFESVREEETEARELVEMLGDLTISMEVLGVVAVEADIVTRFRV